MREARTLPGLFVWGTVIGTIQEASMRWMILLALVFTPAASAQSPLLTSGAQVRFVTKGEAALHTGSIDLATRDSLLVRDCGACTQSRFAMTDFTRLEVLVHPKRTAMGSAVGGGLVGLLGGALLGLGVGTLVDSQHHCPAGGECVHGLGTAAGLLIGAPVGAVVGFTTGAARGRDRWVQIVPER